ncbi:MAG: hypothetical protein V2J25_05350 [Desulfatiglans sp.]|nr:hypothetical protein [Thermodesulfobacteriota bacterium]MEE4352278.1 hypothetical protein [Desulfatiglans sp.]
MNQERKSDDNGGGVDITRLIRSIQRMEGNPDCFRRAGESCGNSDCAWREYCLKRDD